MMMRREEPFEAKMRKLYAEMNEEQFALVKREDLTEQARIVYDQELERRSSLDYQALQAKLASERRATLESQPKITSSELPKAGTSPMTASEISRTRTSSSAPLSVQTLMGLARTIATIGWVFLAISAILVVLGLLIALEGNMTTAIIMIAAGLVGCLQSILIVALGGAIQCFVLIEENTRRAADALMAREEK